MRIRKLSQLPKFNEDLHSELITDGWMLIVQQVPKNAVLKSNGPRTYWRSGYAEPELAAPH